MPGGLKPRAPARNRTEESRRRSAAGHRRVARDELGGKMMDFAPTDLSSPDPRPMLRKRLREEMEALRGILRKAELLAGIKTAGNAPTAPRRGKDGCFLAAKTSSTTATEAEPTASISKRRKTMPVAEIVEPRMSKDGISDLVTRVSSLSEDMPAHILEFLKKECTGHEDGSRGEMEIDIGSMRHSAMFDLKRLLDDFAEEALRRALTNASRSVSRSPQVEQEDGEIVEMDSDAITDSCGDAVVAGKVLCSPPRKIEEGEKAEEEICAAAAAAAAPVATEEIAETGSSPRSSRSSSSSSGSSSSSSCFSSGSSCSRSSDSDSSGSDSDDESVTSRPAPAVLPKNDASPMAVPHKVLCSSPCISSLHEDGDIEELCGGASAAAAEKFAAETVKCPRNSYSSGSAVCPKPLEQRPAAQDHKRPLSQAEYREIIAKGRQKQSRLRNPKRQMAYEKLEEMERNANPISDWIHPMHLRQLGITQVEYAVTFERRVPCRGSPVQRLLGLFLKAE